jgi:lysylphosphatidylglycerol synthetase-like protein (DUF2156 family)
VTARGYLAGGTSKRRPQADDSRFVEVEHGAMLRARAPDLQRLLLDIIVLVAILVGAVVAIGQANAWWTAAIAVAALVIAALGIALVVAAMLRASDASTVEVGRGGVMAGAAVAAVAVVLAIVLPDEGSGATSTARPTAGAAAQTVRDFLATAVLEDNAYVACQYLTPAAQHSVASLAGDSQTCRHALTATQPSLGAIHSEGALHSLRLDTVVRNGEADVAARPSTAVLHR